MTARRSRRTGTAIAASPATSPTTSPRIHAIDADRAAEAATVRDFRQTIDHWAGVYEEMRLVPDPVVDEAYAWVRAREPEPVAPALVHGDYRIGNCLTAGGRVTGILDWELCFVGDPRFDLGYMSLDYAAGKFTTPGSELLNATAERGWFHERYAARSGNPVDPEVVRTFAALGGLMLYAIMTTGVRRLPPGRRRRHPSGLGTLRAARAAAGSRGADGLVTVMDEQIGQLDRGDAAHWNRLTLPHLFERDDLQLSQDGDRLRGPDAHLRRAA